MPTLLVPVDGSDNSSRAVAHALAVAAGSQQPVELHLLNVQLPIASGDVKMFVSQSAIDAYYRDEGEKALAPARRQLDAAGVRYVHHIGVGPVAETVVSYAREKRCDQIIMGTRGMSALGGLLMGSVTTRVVHLSPVPVTLVK